MIEMQPPPRVATHPPRILFLYGSLRARSYSRLLAEEAARILSDMGVAFKKLGMSGKAAHCFLHSLHLRPNHPEALLTFVTLFPQTEALVLYGLGRVLAIGGHGAQVEQVIAGIASARGLAPAALRDKVDGAATRVDLAHWPLARPDLAQYSTFHEGLERLAVTTDKSVDLRGCMARGDPCTPARQQLIEGGSRGHGEVLIVRVNCDA